MPTANMDNPLRLAEREREGEISICLVPICLRFHHPLPLPVPVAVLVPAGALLLTWTRRCSRFMSIFALYLPSNVFGCSKCPVWHAQAVVHHPPSCSLSLFATQWQLKLISHSPIPLGRRGMPAPKESSESVSFSCLNAVVEIIPDFSLSVL